MMIWLIVPYYGGSHRAWADGYAAHSRHQVAIIAHAARFWRWRMQGAAVTLATKARERGGKPDLLLATDMLNVPAFLGLTRDWLADVPLALYCHENQLTYPLKRGERRDLTYGMINWLSMLAADRVFFNSLYHLEDWFKELPLLLKRFPDYGHLDYVSLVKAKSAVLPVGCDLARLEERRTERQCAGSPLILWNQRWEYDKDPDTFFRALDVLASEGVAFQVALAGGSVRQLINEFEVARKHLGDRVVYYGRANAEEYGRLLRQANIVVSTALHEFFGIAIVEAIYCGCFPVLPHRLAYPERIPEQYHDACLYDGFDDLLGRLRWALAHVEEAGRLAGALSAQMKSFDWRQMASRYDRILETVAERH